MILIAASILVLATACSLTFTGTPTPVPTYTPVPLIPVGPNADTAGVPLLELGPNSALPTPTFSPDMFREVGGKKQLLFGDTLLEFKKAEQAFGEGKYQDALEGYLEAQRLHGEPSVVLQNLIGNSYRALVQDEAAIRHFTNALELKDNPTDRINRGIRYMETGQCPPAIEDAKAALTMEPDTGEGVHTDAEANYILAGCYAQQGKYLLALQHAEAALETEKENSYTEIDLETISIIKESIQAVLDGRTWPEDLILEQQAMTHFNIGVRFLEAEKYEEAIASFEAAQEIHGQPSGHIQNRIGYAYSALGQHETAIKHFTAAVKIRDTSRNRVIRSIEYASNHRCAEAIGDAEAALSMSRSWTQRPGGYRDATRHGSTTPNWYSKHSRKPTQTSSSGRKYPAACWKPGRSGTAATEICTWDRAEINWTTGS